MLSAVLGLSSLSTAASLAVCGLDLPRAKLSPASRALDGVDWPAEFPHRAKDLIPEWAGNDRLFYAVPKFAQHASDECRAALADFYGCALPPSGTGAVLDLCSSFTSHYPKGWKGERVAALGLNPLELAVNPSQTEWRVQDLNAQPTLPYADGEFDLITNSLSVDYLTRPLEV